MNDLNNELLEKIKSLEYKCNYIEVENNKHRGYIAYLSNRELKIRTDFIESENKYKSLKVKYKKLKNNRSDLLNELEQKDFYIESICNEYQESINLLDDNILKLESENQDLKDQINNLNQNNKVLNTIKDDYNYLKIDYDILVQDNLKQELTINNLIHEIDRLNDIINELEKNN